MFFKLFSWFEIVFPACLEIPCTLCTYTIKPDFFVCYINVSSFLWIMLGGVGVKPYISSPYHSFGQFEQKLKYLSLSNYFIYQFLLTACSICKLLTTFPLVFFFSPPPPPLGIPYLSSCLCSGSVVATVSLVEVLSWSTSINTFK